MGAIIEGAGHGSGITPTIGHIIERYLLGPDSTRDKVAPRFRLPGEERPGAPPVRVGDTTSAGGGR